MNIFKNKIIKNNTFNRQILTTNRFKLPSWHIFLFALLTPMTASSSEPVSLSSPYSIPNGVNGNEHTYYLELIQSLTTYEQIQAELAKIKKNAKNPIETGPLIKNIIDGEPNGGLIDIDVKLLSLGLPAAIKKDGCAPNLDPSVREAVICTITDGRGNLDEDGIGISTQGLELMAVRLGNPNGMKIIFITQQHGNEVQSTEAALKVIRQLAQSKKSSIQDILDKLNILFLVRANPDGGEPRTECQFGTPFGTVITNDCALMRYNIDPQAGGGYIALTEPEFFGAVGVGYNLNRYHFPTLDKPIRPQETQAMVAAVLAWGPEVIIDMHGDIGKTSCEIDLASIDGSILGLPTALCVAGSDESPVVFSPFTTLEDGGMKQTRSRNLASNLMRVVEKSGFGIANRFAQIRLGAGTLNEGTVDAYHITGAISGGWESINFLNAVAFEVQAIDFVPGVGLVPNVGFTTKWLLGNRLSGAVMKIEKDAIMETLRVVAGWTVAEPADDAGYCDYPLTTGIKVAFPEWPQAFVDAGFPNPGYGPFLVPLLGPLLQVFDSCPTNP